MRDRELLLALRGELKAKGYFERTPGRIIVELVLHASVAVFGAWLALTTDSWLLRIGGIFLSSFGSIGVGTNTHTATHYAASHKRWLNEVLSYVGYPLFLGLSATWWWHKHVAVHHPAPNVVGIDGDADLHPWFAITEEDARTGNAFQRFYYQHLQWFFFPLVLGVTGLRMQIFGVIHILGKIRDGGKRSRQAGIDLACFVAHYSLWVGMPMLWFDPGLVIGVYAARLVVIGYGLFAVLGPGHLPLDAAMVDSRHHKGDYILLQTASTINFTTGPIGGFYCSGLEYQIEHHLFPDISHPHYPAVARHIETFCQAHGYPYRSYTWGRALWEALRTFHSPKPVQYDLGSLRVPEGGAASVSSVVPTPEEVPSLRIATSDDHGSFRVASVQE